MKNVGYYVCMRLFLSSQAISAEQATAFKDLVAKPDSAGPISFALIENAGDVYEEDKKEWMHINCREIMSHNFDVTHVDLREYVNKKDQLHKDLAGYDVIWLGGGNTYYLRWLLKETGADVVIRNLVKSGTVYGGGSAGAVVAGPTLDNFQDADDPQKAPELILEGLRLSEYVVVPHWQNEKFASVMKHAQSQLAKQGFQTVPITDEQAVIIVDDATPRII
jgi:dipeptidase E